MNIAGVYIYIEVTSKTDYSKARLVSPVIRDPGDTCRLQFWYHMRGSAIGTLTVYTKRSTNGMLDRIWSRSGNQGDLWTQAEVDFVWPYEEDFQVK